MEFFYVDLYADGNHVGCQAENARSVRHWYVYRNTVSSRFNLCEWDQNNRVNYCVARTEMDTSERARTDAWRAVRMTEQRTRTRQNSNTRKLSTSSVLSHC